MRTLAIVLLFAGARAQAASCCAAGLNVPSLITGDDRAQVTLSANAASVAADAPVSGGAALARAAADREGRQTLTFTAAALLADRWQAGLSVPVIRRSRAHAGGEAADSGLGDLMLSAGYELLPEWDYNPWRPRGYVFLQAGMPTGVSVYDTTAQYDVDVRGTGSYSLGAGVLLLKSWGAWDASLLGELHRALPRTISSALGELELRPGWGTSALLTVGWSPGASALRLGVSLAPSYQGELETSGAFASRAASQLTWDAGAQAAYVFDGGWAVGVAYHDQTLLGGARNAALYRGVTARVQRRWER